ncbi:MAG: hypothetical protein JST54_21010 [Deltaproteobacteria bacterium]|nr:hypothetical protein [Deltaproteobacteria bacterium]
MSAGRWALAIAISVSFATTGCSSVSCRSDLADGGCLITVECGGSCPSGAKLLSEEPAPDGGRCILVDESCT